MGHRRTMRFDGPLVRTADLSGTGSDGGLRAEVRGGALVRLRSGAYVNPGAWDASTSEQRILLRAHAVAARAVHPPVFMGTTAAAAWRLPLLRVGDDRVEVAQPGVGHRSRGDVVRRVVTLGDDDIVEREGLRVTSLARTLFDVARTASVETALAAFDGGLRAVAWRGHGRYDEESAAALRKRVQEMADAAGSARGIRQARFVIAFADGRAQLPGESLSRLWMHRLHADAPVLQAEVRLRGGRRAYPDFAWPRRRRFGEFDGDGKYVDPAMTAGRSIRETLREQRARESAVTEATGWLPVRWGWERLTSLSTFAAFLRSHGVLD